MPSLSRLYLFRVITALTERSLCSSSRVSTRIFRSEPTLSNGAPNSMLEMSPAPSRLTGRSRWMLVLLSVLAWVASTSSAWAVSPTTTSLFITPDAPATGQVITMTAQVSSDEFTVAGGTVTFTDTCNGITETLGTVQVQSLNGAAGAAILKTQVGGVGGHQF